MRAICSLILLFGSAAFAAQPTKEELFAACDLATAVCQAPYAGEKLARLRHTGLFTRMDKVANKLAVSWADGILAGDYHAFGRTEVETLIRVKDGSKVVGYILEYFEEAIYTAGPDCHPGDGDGWTWHGECQVGRIYEVGYASADLKAFERDDKRVSTFFATPDDKRTRGY